MNSLKILFSLIVFISSISFAQEEDSVKFNFIKKIETTPVKSQGETGTCWAFSTTSFIETELMRMGKINFDLSEMYVVRNTYPKKAENYVRRQGAANFGQGGQAHDVINVIKNYGLMPGEFYTGRDENADEYNHKELYAISKGFLDAVLERRGGEISPKWREAYNATLDIYLGKKQDQFVYDDQDFTPLSFRDYLGIDPDDYVEFTSFTHHPFYEKFILELPDNWSNAEYYNVPLEDLMKIIDSALKDGYSVVWDGDFSEESYSSKSGFAVIPEEGETDKKTEESDDEEIITLPEKEKNITQSMRQETFDNFATTDDHLMHIVGIAEDENGSRYYYTKDSWDTEGKYKGFIFLSEPYVKLKTIAILLHKDAVPEYFKEKMGMLN